jgi:hypothetical protein
MSQDDGYQPKRPGQNDLGYHHPMMNMDGKVLPSGKMKEIMAGPDARTQGPGSTHVSMAGKVASTQRVTPISPVMKANALPPKSGGLPIMSKRKA